MGYGGAALWGMGSWARVREKAGPPGENTGIRPFAPFLLGSPDTPEPMSVADGRGRPGSPTRISTLAGAALHAVHRCNE